MPKPNRAVESALKRVDKREAKAAKAKTKPQYARLQRYFFCYCFLTLANVNLRSFYLPMWDSPLLTPIRVKPVQTAAFV